MDKKLIDSIKKEIQNDPDNKGYSGKTAKQIVDLINNPTVVKTDVLQPEIEIDPLPGTKIGEKIEIKDAPVLRVTVGIPGAPNAITEDEITEALK